MFDNILEPKFSSRDSPHPAHLNLHANMLSIEGKIFIYHSD